MREIGGGLSAHDWPSLWQQAHRNISTVSGRRLDCGKVHGTAFLGAFVWLKETRVFVTYRWVAARSTFLRAKVNEHPAHVHAKPNKAAMPTTTMTMMIQNTRAAYIETLLLNYEAARGPFHDAAPTDAQN